MHLFKKVIVVIIVISDKQKEEMDKYLLIRMVTVEDVSIVAFGVVSVVRGGWNILNN